VALSYSYTQREWLLSDSSFILLTMRETCRPSTSLQNSSLSKVIFMIPDEGLSTAVILYFPFIELLKRSRLPITLCIS